MSSDTPQEPSPQDEPRSVRLTLAYDEAGVRVIDRTPVTKPVPPNVEEVPAFTAARAGEPQLPSHAVERGVRRHPQPLPSGVFTVIVPDDERAESVVLLAGPGSRGAEHGRQAGPPGGPVELTRFALR
jgi:hypothetical protein